VGRCLPAAATRPRDEADFEHKAKVTPDRSSSIGFGTLIRRICSHGLEGSRFGACQVTPRISSER